MGMRAFAIVFRVGAAVLLSVVAWSRTMAQVDGRPRWAFSGGTGSFIDSSPAVSADGIVYVGVFVDKTPSSGLVLAIDRDGNKKWQFPKVGDPFIEPVESSPAISGDGQTLYFGCGDGKLYALNRDTGTQKWSYDTHGPEIISSPVLGPGPDGEEMIYVISTDLILHAVTKDGVERWHHAAGSAVSNTSPAIGDDGTLYVGAPDQLLYALNPDATGSEKWRYSPGAAILSSVAIGPDGTLYFGTTDNQLFAVTREGRDKWKYLADDLVVAQPTVAADGTIYFGSLGGKFHALNPDKTEKWTAAIGDAIVSAAAVRADGTIIFGVYDGSIRALNPENGSEKWKQVVSKDDLIESSPVIAPDGSIYVGSFDGKLYAFDGTAAPLSTVSSWPMFNHDAAHSGRARPFTTGGYLVNLSTYAQAGGASTLIAGFVVQGAAPKNFLIRAVGPTLAQQFGVPGTMPDPALSIVSAGREVAANDNWSSTDENRVNLLNADVNLTWDLGVGNKDAALTVSLAPANYNAVVTAADRVGGIALVEIYDLERGAPNSRLANISTRAQVGSGAGVLTAGLVIAGPTNSPSTLRVLVRAIGPGLLQFPGVTGVLSQPIMTLYDAGQRQLLRNTGWTTGGLTEDLASAARLTGAFGLVPTGAGAADCAAVTTLSPGNYTIQVSGANGTTGEALVEVYVIP